jgi:hypothetical protein
MNVDRGEQSAAVVESVLGAAPQEFESPIFRHADLQEHSMTAAGMRASRVAPEWDVLRGEALRVTAAVRDARWCR